jgi:hypothetical protein
MPLRTILNRQIPQRCPQAGDELALICGVPDILRANAVFGAKP